MGMDQEKEDDFYPRKTSWFVLIKRDFMKVSWEYHVQFLGLRWFIWEFWSRTRGHLVLWDVIFGHWDGWMGWAGDSWCWFTMDIGWRFTYMFLDQASVDIFCFGSSRRCLFEQLADAWGMEFLSFYAAQSTRDRA
jgi:hypothetical protein